MRVDPDQIRKHATRVMQVSADVQTARRAGDATIDEEVFGVMCGFLAGKVCEASQNLDETIGSIPLTLTSEGLREMALQYEIDDDDAKVRFHLGDGDGLPT